MQYLTKSLAFATLALAIPLYEPSGPYHVGYTQHIFNHTPPHDPTSPGTFLIGTIYYPTRQIPNASIPYIDPTSAQFLENALGIAPGVLGNLTTRLQYDAPTLLGSSKVFGKAKSPYQTLIFMPGAGLSSHVYTAYLCDLASHGHAILALDHPGEAPYLPLLTPYNGSTGVYGYPDFTAFPPTYAVGFGVYDYRVSDILAATQTYFPKLVREKGWPFQVKQYGVFGHSIGGAGAAGAMAARPEVFSAGVNLDGTFLQVVNRTSATVDGSIPASKLQRPFLEVVSEARFGGNEASDPSFGYFNAAQCEALKMVQVGGAAHLDFSDIPIWVERLGLGGLVDAGLVASVGGGRVTALVVEVLRDFFGGTTGGKVKKGGLGGVDEWIAEAPELSLLAESDGRKGKACRK